MSDLKYMLEAKVGILYNKICFYKSNWKPEYKKLYDKTNKLLEETLVRLEEVD